MKKLRRIHRSNKNGFFMLSLTVDSHERTTRALMQFFGRTQQQETTRTYSEKLQEQPINSISRKGLMIIVAVLDAMVWA